MHLFRIPLSTFTQMWGAALQTWVLDFVDSPSKSEIAIQKPIQNVALLTYGINPLHIGLDALRVCEELARCSSSSQF